MNVGALGDVPRARCGKEGDDAQRRSPRIARCRSVHERRDSCPPYANRPRDHLRTGRSPEYRVHEERDVLRMNLKDKRTRRIAAACASAVAVTAGGVTIGATFASANTPISISPG